MKTLPKALSAKVLLLTVLFGLINATAWADGKTLIHEAIEQILKEPLEQPLEKLPARLQRANSEFEIYKDTGDLELDIQLNRIRDQRFKCTLALAAQEDLIYELRMRKAVENAKKLEAQILRMKDSYAVLANSFATRNLYRPDFQPQINLQFKRRLSEVRARIEFFTGRIDEYSSDFENITGMVDPLSDPVLLARAFNDIEQFEADQFIQLPKTSILNPKKKIEKDEDGLPIFKTFEEYQASVLKQLGFDSIEGYRTYFFSPTRQPYSAKVLQSRSLNFRLDEFAIYNLELEGYQLTQTSQSVSFSLRSGAFDRHELRKSELRKEIVNLLDERSDHFNEYILWKDILFERSISLTVMEKELECIAHRKSDPVECKKQDPRRQSSRPGEELEELNLQFSMKLSKVKDYLDALDHYLDYLTRMQVDLAQLDHLTCSGPYRVVRHL